MLLNIQSRLPKVFTLRHHPHLEADEELSWIVILDQITGVCDARCSHIESFSGEMVLQNLVALVRLWCVLYHLRQIDKLLHSTVTVRKTSLGRDCNQCHDWPHSRS